MRFVDRKDKESLIKKSPEFRVRNYGSFMIWISYAFILISLGIAVHVNKVIYGLYSPGGMTMHAHVMVSIIFLILIMLILLGYVFFVIFRIKSLVIAVEFQNMIFASSMKVHTLFCFIINDCHTVIYADKKALDVFSEKNVNIFDDILNHDGISIEDKAKLIKAVSSGVAEEVPLIYTEASGDKKNALIVLDPIEKPKGYFVVRGY